MPFCKNNLNLPKVLDTWYNKLLILYIFGRAYSVDIKIEM